MDPSQALLDQWRVLTGAGWPGAPAAGSLAPEAAAGLGAAAAAYTRFAQDFARLRERAGAGVAPDAFGRAQELAALAERFFTAALPPAPTAGAGTAAGALAAWSELLRAIAQDAAARFARRLETPDAPANLRAAFDAWIDSAEAAFQQAAHSEAFVAAQTRLINDFVAGRAAQQAFLERGARLAGMPTRADVDALYARVRALEADLARSRDAPPAPRPRRAPPRAP